MADHIITVVREIGFMRNITERASGSSMVRFCDKEMK